MTYASIRDQRRAENAALDARTHVPAVDDFGNQYLAPAAEPVPLTLDALTEALRDPRLRAAIDAAFVAPGDFGPAKGYYGAATDHFIEMVLAALASPDKGEPQP